MSQKLEPLSDFELDKLLSAASQPPDCVGLQSRVASKLKVNLPPRDNVVPLFKPVVAKLPTRRFGRDISIAAALAASLVVGILASSNLEISNVMDGIAGLNSSALVADFAPSGFDDLSWVDEEKLS